MAQRQRDYYASLPGEEKERLRLKRIELASTPENKMKVSQYMREYYASNPDARERARNQLRDWYKSLSEEEKAAISKRCSDNINRPEIRQKLVEAIATKIVVNRMFIFRSKNDFIKFTGKTSNCFAKANESRNRLGFDFIVTNGLFIEDYCENKHKGLPFHDGVTDIPKLDFDCLPRSKAVVMDESTVFLSMNEASKFCNGKTVEATADFITKNIKLGKPAMGHYWRVATSEEIKEEIFRRLNNLINNYKH